MSIFLPAAVLAAIAGLTAATGGTSSPARLLVVAAVVYVATRRPPAEAPRWLVACVAVAALPLAYDRSDGYVVELAVLAPSCLLVGAAIVRGRLRIADLDERARAQALVDPLTELPNRCAAMAWLRAHVEAGERVGLVVAHLDGLTQLNAERGYDEGDRILRDAACRLHRSVRSSDLIAQLAGDELAVLTPDGRQASMRVLATRVTDTLNAMRLPVRPGVGWASGIGDVDRLVTTAAGYATSRSRPLSTS